MSRLRISPDLALDADAAAVQPFGILAMRGAGKTNTAAVMAEEFHAAGVPFVVVDPVGSWWGLRSAADGKGEGLPVPIFGGRHGDVPLEEAGGQVIADLVVDERLSCVVDTSELGEAAKHRFLTAFAERLFRRNEEPLHVFLEEADDYAPQRVGRGPALATLGAMQRLVKRGRFKGLGVTMITQRSAALNKDLLTQIETLIVLRTTSPQDRKAIGGWVEHMGQSRELLDSLPSLKDGEAWIWSPHALGLLDRIHVRRRRTFDSGATPTAGRKKRAPATLADVDLEAIAAQMKATIERAKATDPAELQKRIRELERHLNERPPASERVVEVEKLVEVPVLGDRIEKVEQLVASLLAIAETLTGVSDAIRSDVQRLEGLGRRAQRSPAPTGLTTGATGPSRREVSAAAAIARPAAPERTAPPAGAGDTPRDVSLGRGERKVLAVLRQWPDGRSYNELAFLAGYSAKASTLGVILSKLRQAGLVEPGNQPVRLSSAGVQAAGGYEPLPTGDELLQHWLRHPRIGEGERKVLGVLIEHYPDDLSHEELCEAAGYSPLASTMGVILSKLRKLGLVDKGVRRLAPEFAEAIAA